MMPFRRWLPLIAVVITPLGCTGSDGQLGGAGGHSSVGGTGGSGGGVGTGGGATTSSGSGGAGGGSGGGEPAGPMPAWLADKPLDEWFPIPGTTGAAGAGVGAYSGMALREDTSELWIAAAGGHGAGLDNRVVSLDLRLDAPTWVLRKAASAQTAEKVAHYPDGAPASRHLYQSIQWVGAVHRVMLFGVRYTFPTGSTYPNVDGFDPDTNSWDPAGTWPDSPGGYGFVRDGSDRVWTDGLAVWSPTTKEWSKPLASITVGIRFPGAFDSKRNQIFTLMWGDGQGYGSPTRSASRIPVNGTAQTPVAFNASEALTEFDAAQPSYAALDYDPVNDRFFFYDGNPSHGIFVITPNDGDTWDMSKLVFGPGSATPPQPASGGLQSRMHYVPQLKGFVLLPTAAGGLYFMRTSK